MTVSADARLMPRPPARVDNRNTNCFESTPANWLLKILQQQVYLSQTTFTTVISKPARTEYEVYSSHLYTVISEEVNLYLKGHENLKLYGIVGFNVPLDTL